MGARRARSDSGASAVEFALIMIPLFALVFGLIQYGLYFWAYQGASDIARSAARSAAVGDRPTCTGTSGFETAVKSDINDLTGSGADAEVTRTYASGPSDPDTSTVNIGDVVTVTVKFKSFDLNFPFVPFIDDGMVASRAHARVDYVTTQPEAC